VGCLYVRNPAEAGLHTDCCMPTASPSLTLRALFSQAAARAGLDATAPVLAGLTPAAKALAGVVSARLQSGVTLLVAPTDKDVEQLTADARFFYAALEGTSEEATDQAVLPLPSLQVDPYRGMTPHFRVAAARARALVGAAAGTARLIVASAGALLPTVSPPERLLRAARELRAGSEIDPQALADLLVDAGFTRADPVDEHGAFAVRGGIVDVFPASDAEPVRLEFVGDMVETLRRFDPTTQRSTAAIDYVSIVPVRERFDDDHGLSILDFLSASHGVRVVLSEREEIEQQARKLRDQLDASYNEADARGHLAATTPDEAFTTWDAIEPRLSSARHIEELAVEEEGDDHGRSAHADRPNSRVRHVSCQPALEFRGRAADWIADLRQARQRGDTVLFVADSPGRAERTVEILQEYDVLAVPAERAEDAHHATVLVALGSLSHTFLPPMNPETP